MTSLGCNPNRQSPTVWANLGYVNCDVTLVSDSRYGKAYRYRVNDSSRSPTYDPGTDKGTAELTRIAYAHASDSYGRWDWYALAIKLDPSWAQPTWNTLFEPNFPRFTSPPESINTAYRNPLGSYCWTYSTIGNCTLYWDLFRYDGTVGSLVRQDRWLMPVQLGKWTEFVLGIKWETNTSGAYKVYTRVPEDGETVFTLRDSQTNVNTYQSGGSDPATTTDIMCLYSGTEPRNGWPSPLWTNVAYFNGLRVYANEQDALAAFG